MNKQSLPESTNVAIIGGGFAGLTLARQLKRELPELSVTVIERSEEARRLHHKVGESTVSPQGYYLGQWLALFLSGRAFFVAPRMGRIWDYAREYGRVSNGSRRP